MVSGKFFKYVSKPVFLLIFIFCGAWLLPGYISIYFFGSEVTLIKIWQTIFTGAPLEADAVSDFMLFYGMMCAIPMQMWFFNYLSWWIGLRRGKMYWVYGSLPVWIRVLFVTELVLTILPIAVFLLTMAFYFIMMGINLIF